MPVEITVGLEETLQSGERNAFELLRNLPLREFNELKEMMELDVPDVLGRTTLDRFEALCRDLNLDISEAGINTFKESHQLSNEGLLHGIIGPQTALQFFQVLMKTVDDDTPGAAPAPAANATPRINDAGLAMVKEFEGLHKLLSDGRVQAYLDPVNIPTIGYGHTEGVRMGQVITRQEAEDLLREDMGIFEQAVDKLIAVALTSNQFSALVVFSFNVGAGNLKMSTLRRKLNQGDYDGAAHEFGKWTLAKGQRLPGLVRRRAAERALFEMN